MANSMESVGSWTPKQVGLWLKVLQTLKLNNWRKQGRIVMIFGLEDAVQPYIQSFIMAGVTGEQLLNLSHRDMDRLHITKLGHQEIILEAVDLLCALNFGLENETLQSLTVALGLNVENLEMAMTVRNQQSILVGLAGPRDNNKLPPDILCAICDVLSAAKAVVSWLDRTPFVHMMNYIAIRNRIVRICLGYTTSIHKDPNKRDAEETIVPLCKELAMLSQSLQQSFKDDPQVCHPARVEVVTLTNVDHKLGLGMFIQSSFNGTHYVTGTKEGSPAHTCKRIHPGDEILQVNYQTVVGWKLKKLVEALKEDPHGVVITFKKRPKPSRSSGTPSRPSSSSSSKLSQNSRHSSGNHIRGRSLDSASPANSVGRVPPSPLVELYLPPPPPEPYKPSQPKRTQNFFDRVRAPHITQSQVQVHQPLWEDEDMNPPPSQPLSGRSQSVHIPSYAHEQKDTWDNEERSPSPPVPLSGRSQSVNFPGHGQTTYWDGEEETFSPTDPPPFTARAQSFNMPSGQQWELTQRDFLEPQYPVAMSEQSLYNTPPQSQWIPFPVNVSPDTETSAQASRYQSADVQQCDDVDQRKPISFPRPARSHSLHVPIYGPQWEEEEVPPEESLPAYRPPSRQKRSKREDREPLVSTRPSRESKRSSPRRSSRPTNMQMRSFSPPREEDGIILVSAEVTPLPEDLRVTPPARVVPASPEKPEVSPPPDRHRVDPPPEKPISPVEKPRVMGKDRINPQEKSRVTPPGKPRVAPLEQPRVDPPPVEPISPPVEKRVTPSGKNRINPPEKSRVTFPPGKPTVAPLEQPRVDPPPEEPISPVKIRVTPSGKNRINPQEKSRVAKPRVAPLEQPKVDPLPEKPISPVKIRVTPSGKNRINPQEKSRVTPPPGKPTVAPLERPRVDPPPEEPVSPVKIRVTPSGKNRINPPEKSRVTPPPGKPTVAPLERPRVDPPPEEPVSPVKIRVTPSGKNRINPPEKSRVTPPPGKPRVERPRDNPPPPPHRPAVSPPPEETSTEKGPPPFMNDTSKEIRLVSYMEEKPTERRTPVYVEDKPKTLSPPTQVPAQREELNVGSVSDNNGDDTSPVTEPLCTLHISEDSDDDRRTSELPSPNLRDEHVDLHTYKSSDVKFGSMEFPPLSARSQSVPAIPVTPVPTPEVQGEDSEEEAASIESSSTVRSPLSSPRSPLSSPRSPVSSPRSPVSPPRSPQWEEGEGLSPTRPLPLGARSPNYLLDRQSKYRHSATFSNGTENHDPDQLVPTPQETLREMMLRARQNRRERERPKSLPPDTSIQGFRPGGDRQDRREGSSQGLSDQVRMEVETISEASTSAENSPQRVVPTRPSSQPAKGQQRHSSEREVIVINKQVTTKDFVTPNLRKNTGHMSSMPAFRVERETRPRGKAPSRGPPPPYEQARMDGRHSFKSVPEVSKLPAEEVARRTRPLTEQFSAKLAIFEGGSESNVMKRPPRKHFAEKISELQEPAKSPAKEESIEEESTFQRGVVGKGETDDSTIRTTRYVHRISLRFKKDKSKSEDANTGETSPKAVDSEPANVLPVSAHPPKSIHSEPANMVPVSVQPPKSIHSEHANVLPVSVKLAKPVHSEPANVLPVSVQPPKSVHSEPVNVLPASVHRSKQTFRKESDAANLDDPQLKFRSSPTVAPPNQEKLVKEKTRKSSQRMNPRESVRSVQQEANYSVPPNKEVEPNIPPLALQVDSVRETRTNRPVQKEVTPKSPTSAQGSYSVTIVGGVPVRKESSSQQNMQPPQEAPVQRRMKNTGTSKYSRRRMSCKDLGHGDCQGWLWKKKEQKKLFGHKWKKLWFVLKKVSLYYYANPDAMKAEGIINLPDYSIVYATESECGRKFGIKAAHPEIKTFYFATECKEDRDRWLNKLQLASIQYNRDSIMNSIHDEDLDILELAKHCPAIIEGFGYYSESDEESEPPSPNPGKLSPSPPRKRKPSSPSNIRREQERSPERPVFDEGPGVSPTGAQDRRSIQREEEQASRPTSVPNRSSRQMEREKVRKPSYLEAVNGMRKSPPPENRPASNPPADQWAQSSSTSSDSECTNITPISSTSSSSSTASSPMQVVPPPLQFGSTVVPPPPQFGSTDELKKLCRQSWTILQEEKMVKMLEIGQEKLSEKQEKELKLQKLTRVLKDKEGNLQAIDRLLSSPTLTSKEMQDWKDQNQHILEDVERHKQDPEPQQKNPNRPNSHPGPTPKPRTSIHRTSSQGPIEEMTQRLSLAKRPITSISTDLDRIETDIKPPVPDIDDDEDDSYSSTSL